MTCRLCLSEAILLLARDDDTGEPIRGVGRGILDRTLVAAALAELVLRDRFRYLPPEPPRVDGSALRRWLVAPSAWSPLRPDLRLTDSTPTGYTYPDRLLTRIAAHPATHRPQAFTALALIYVETASEWRERMGTSEEVRFAAADLVRRGALAESPPPHYLRHRHPPRYLATYVVDTGEDSLRLYLKSALTDDSPPDRRTLALLTLVQTSGLTANVFGHDARRGADRRIKELLRQASTESWMTRGIPRLALGDLDESFDSVMTRA